MLLGAVFVFLLAIILFIFLKPAFLCGEGEIGTKSSGWQIINNLSSNAEILWQRLGIPGLDTFGVTNSKLAVSDSHVLIGRRSVFSLCDNMVAFNVNTGQMEWSSPIGFLHWIEPVSDGYLVVFGDTSVTKLDNKGRQTWFQFQLPSRSARILYTSEDDLYFPAVLDTYILSEGNTSIEILEDKIIRGTFDNFIVFQTSNDSLEIVNSVNQKEVMQLQLSQTIPENIISPEISIDHLDNILLVYYGAQRTHLIEAFEIDTGQLLWSIDKNFNSIPILMDDKILAYTFDDTLELYDAISGSSLGQITLSRIDSDDEGKAQLDSPVWLSGRGNIISILYEENNDLVTMNIQREAHDG